MGHAGGLRNPTIGVGARFVGLPTNQAMTVRAERRAMVALVAVFVLLVQALIPALASAAPSGAGEMLICTQMGLQAAPDDGAPAAADHACKHCLCPAPVSDPPPVVSVRRVDYAVTQAPVTPRSHRIAPRARAPPRPPGQGPPASDA